MEGYRIELVGKNSSGSGCDSAGDWGSGRISTDADG